MSRRETIVAIRNPETGCRHKITKVVGYKEGGFGVLTPYHSARSGYLTITPVDYKKVGEYSVSAQEATAFSVEDRVKLSYHPDGFVQFSGEIGGKVISGKDPTTGLPRGIGLTTKPLSSPVSSGPTFGVTVWGLDDFERVKKGASNVLVFEEHDWYYRGCNPATATGWFVEFFVFPARYWAAARKSRRGFSLSLSFYGFEASMGVIEMKMIELPNQPVFLAGFASRCRTKFSAPSGWILAGPGEVDATGMGRVLHAFYPDPGLSTPATPLDRNPGG
jgi:hypothetical protein